jgi:hypothetical protein
VAGLGPGDDHKPQLDRSRCRRLRRKDGFGSPRSGETAAKHAVKGAGARMPEEQVRRRPARAAERDARASSDGWCAGWPTAPAPAIATRGRARASAGPCTAGGEPGRGRQWGWRGAERHAAQSHRPERRCAGCYPPPTAPANAHRRARPGRSGRPCAAGRARGRGRRRLGATTNGTGRTGAERDKTNAVGVIRL